MFPIFSYLSVSAFPQVSLNTKVYNDAFFEIKDKDGRSVTKDGFYLAFRYYDANNQTHLHIKRTDYGVLTIPEIAEIKIEQDTQTGYSHNPDYIYQCKLLINVSNLQRVSSLKYDLGIYAELPSGAILKRAMHNNAIEAKMGEAQYHRILLKDQHFPDVSTIYIGAADATEDRYWKDSQDKEPKDTDLAYAFSWMQRRISDSDILGCSILPSEDFEMEMILKDYTPYTETQPRRFQVKSELINYGSTTDFEINIIPGFQVYKNFKMTDEDYKLNLTVDFNIPSSSNIFTGGIVIYDKKNYLRSSNNLYWKYYLEGSPHPKIKWDLEPADEYEIGQSIHIKGSINEDVTLEYRLNDGAIQKLTSEKEITYRYTPFDTTIPLTGLEAGKDFQFSFRGSSLQNTTELYTKKIRIRNAQKATIHSAFSSFSRVLPGEKIVIFGEVSNNNENTDIHISAGWNNENTLLEIASVSYKNKLKTFSGYFVIPSNASAGKYMINLQASAGSSKSVMKSINVTVISSEAPQPAQITAITDDSSNIKGNSAFNLKYGENKGLSHNNEGFYVAYRLYDEQQNIARSDIHYVKKNNNNQDTTDKVTVKYMGSTDEYSNNYFQARFNVTNDGYYDQLIDLSVFVDSDFGQQSQEISMKPDGTGIIVRDESQNLYYTVFTSYGDYPDVSYINIDATVARESNTEIPLEKMPFFTLHQTKLYKGNDPMYSLSWIRQKIPAGQSVIFALTFAGYDIIRTPSKIEKEISVVKEVYSKNDQPTLTFKIFDENINELLNYVLTINNVVKKKDNFTVKRAAETIQYTIESLNDDVVEYSLKVTDPLNYVTMSSGKFITYNKPELLIEMNNDFIKGAEIPVNASVKHSHNGEIKYQWGKNAKVETLNPFTKSNQMMSSSKNIKPVDSLQVRRLPYPLIFWAEDENGVKSDEITNYVLFDNPKKPVLSMVGLSKKKAKPSEQIIGFAVVKDDTEFRTVQLYYRIGNEGNFIPVQGATHELETTTADVFPFYWSPPTGTPSGVNDVYFRVKDSSDQFSDEMPSVTLNIGY